MARLEAASLEGVRGIWEHIAPSGPLPHRRTFRAARQQTHRKCRYGGEEKPRHGGSTEPVAELPMRTIRPETEESAPV